MGDNQHRRIDFVDLTKGVCIILVVMAHIGGAFDQLDKHSILLSHASLFLYIRNFLQAL